MAWTHHCLVQYCAELVGKAKPIFRDYCIIGDDIVIADHAVAGCYQNLLKGLGMPINLSKSIVSKNGSFEFAKRSFLRGIDVTGVSVKQLSLAGSDLSSMRSLVGKESKRFPHLAKPVALAVIRGRGWRVKGSILGPFSRLSRGVRYSYIYATQPTSI